MKSYLLDMLGSARFKLIVDKDNDNPGNGIGNS